MPRPKKGMEHPRQEYHDRIKLMTAIGIPHSQIAGVLKMGLDTLHNHYKEDLEYGASEANTIVGGKIFEAAKKGESWACSLWAARRMGWKETNIQELSGPNGSAVKIEYGASAKLNGLINAIAKRSGEAGEPAEERS